MNWLIPTAHQTPVIYVDEPHTDRTQCNSRKAICARATKASLITRASSREAKKRKVYSILLSSKSGLTSEEVASKLGVAKTHVREMLVEFIDEGLVKRERIRQNCSAPYYYEVVNGR